MFGIVKRDRKQAEDIRMTIILVYMIDWTKTVKWFTIILIIVWLLVYLII